MVNFRLAAMLLPLSQSHLQLHWEDTDLASAKDIMMAIMTVATAQLHNVDERVILVGIEQRLGLDVGVLAGELPFRYWFHDATCVSILYLQG